MNMTDEQMERFELESQKAIDWAADSREEPLTDGTKIEPGDAIIDRRDCYHPVEVGRFLVVEVDGDNIVTDSWLTPGTLNTWTRQELLEPDDTESQDQVGIIKNSIGDADPRFVPWLQRPENQIPPMPDEPTPSA